MAKQEPVNKYEFSVDIDGKKTNLVVVKPTRKNEQGAEEERARVFAKLFREKALVNEEIAKFARERNLWDDARQTTLEGIDKFLDESKGIVTGHVKGTTKSEARKVAIEMRKKRNERLAIQRGVSRLSNETAESQAENARFNFIMAKCVLNADTNKPYYTSAEDMLSREEDPVFEKAIRGMYLVYLGEDPDFQKAFPENKFLLKYGYCNEELLLIDPVTKKLVDEDGKFIDEKGRWVNAEGHLINDKGQLVDEYGEIQGETFEFLDDEPVKPVPPPKAD